MFGGPSLALPVTQWVVNHVMHLSAFVPLICLSGGSSAHLSSIVPVTSLHPPTPPICPSFPSFSLLRDCLFCHYFLAAGGNSGNLVNPLTTNCPLLPRCLNKQNGGGGGVRPPRNYKRQVATVTPLLGSLHFYSLQPASHFQSHFILRLSEMSGKVWILCLCFCVSVAEAHIWAWMLNMPHRPLKDGVRTLRDHPAAARAATVRH